MKLKIVQKYVPVFKDREPLRSFSRFALVADISLYEVITIIICDSLLLCF